MVSVEKEDDRCKHTIRLFLSGFAIRLGRLKLFAFTIPIAALDVFEFQVDDLMDDDAAYTAGP